MPGPPAYLDGFDVLEIGRTVDVGVTESEKLEGCVTCLSVRLCDAD